MCGCHNLSCSMCLFILSNNLCVVTHRVVMRDWGYSFIDRPVFFLSSVWIGVCLTVVRPSDEHRACFEPSPFFHHFFFYWWVFMPRILLQENCPLLSLIWLFFLHLWEQKDQENCNLLMLVWVFWKWFYRLNTVR